MKYIKIIFLIMALAVTLEGFGQSREAMDRIRSARIALITERLGLSPEQAERFWPLYREFNEKRRGIRGEWRHNVVHI